MTSAAEDLTEIPDDVLATPVSGLGLGRSTVGGSTVGASTLAEALGRDPTLLVFLRHFG